MVTHDPHKTAPATGPDDQKMPLYQKIGAGVLFLLLVGALLLWHDRLSADFWPPDSARVGPNLVASVIQAVVVTIVAILLWPPWRKRLHKFVDRKLAPIHEHLTELRHHHEANAEALQSNADALDEIHRHLKIGKHAVPAKKAAGTKKG